MKSKTFLLIFYLLFEILTPGVGFLTSPPVLGAQNVALMPLPILQFFDQNGKPLASGKIYTCVAGQSCPGNPQATFTDSTGGTQNANPIILNSSGFPQSSGNVVGIWLTAGTAYKFVVQNSAGVQQWVSDNVMGLASTVAGTAQTSTTVSFSATPIFTSLAQNQLFKMTLTGNVTSSSLVMTAVSAPAIVSFEFTQDNVGSHTVVFPGTVVGADPVASAANAITLQSFLWDGSTATAIGPARQNTAGTAFFSNGITATALNNIKLCNANTAGSDMGAKINTLDAALGASTPGIIFIDQSCYGGTTITTQPQSVANAGVFHILWFMQGGTYQFNVNAPVGNTVIYSPNAPASTGAPGGGFVIRGTGQDTILKFSGTATYAYNIPCGASIEHFTVDLTSVTSMGGITTGGISSAHCQFGNINDVRVKNGNGIGFVSGCFTDYWTVTGLWTTGSTANDGTWIGCMSTNWRISGSHFNSNGGNGLDFGGCSQCSVTGSEMIGNGTLHGSCSITDRSGLWIAADSHSDGTGIGSTANEITATGNYMAGNWIYGLQFWEASGGTIDNDNITGNVMAANGTCGGGGGVGIIINNTSETFSNNVVRSNNIHDNTGWGVQLVSAGGTFTNYVSNDLLANTFLNNSSGLFSIDNYAGVLGSLLQYEGAAPSGQTLIDVCYGDSTAHWQKCSNNNGAFGIQQDTIVGNIGSLPTCASALEGLHAVANNCNAGCAAAGTCTAGGTTHCEVYCNGTAYKETGN